MSNAKSKARKNIDATLIPEVAVELLDVWIFRGFSRLEECTFECRSTHSEDFYWETL